MMDAIDTILNLAIIAATLYLARAVNYKPEPSKVELETQQAIARIENLLHHFVEQKAARVSDEVDTLLTGGFEVSRGTPFQKEQRAVGNAVSAGLPSGVLAPRFQVGDYVHVKDTPHWFIVGSVIWSEKDGCYTYSDGNSVATIHSEFKLQSLIPPRFKIGQRVYKTNEVDFTFVISAICYNQSYNQFTYQGGAIQPYWICEQDLEICGVKS